MKMNILNVQATVLLLVTLVNSAISLPFRAFSSRSVPGRLRASSEPDLKDYLTSYLEMVKQNQLQNPQMQYSLPEYEPVYQQGYISRKPEINPETIAALLPYLYQSDSSDYSYDYNAGAAPSAPNSYSDDEGIWYDDSTSPEMVTRVDPRDKNNQEAALLQLFLDHLAGKYSLEDLETLERQAAIEDNTENQLQSLMPRKKSKFPLFGTLPVPRKFIGFPERQGQKEEPFAVPVTSARKPVFARNSATAHKWGNKQEIRTTSSPHPTKPSTDKSHDIKTEKLTKVDGIQTAPSTASSSLVATTTMEPAIKSAYEAFLAYLDQERFLRKTADEAKHSPQKRFISEPKSLTQQLASLKKTIT